MNILLIHDNEGRIIFTEKAEGNTENTFSTIFLNVPEDKILLSIDPVTKKPIYEDKPKDAIALLNDLKEKLDQQEAMSSELESALYDIAALLAGIAEGGGE